MAKSQWLRNIAQTMMVTTVILSASVATAAEEKNYRQLKRAKKLPLIALKVIAWLVI